jgi:hypothetical protein
MRATCATIHLGALRENLRRRKAQARSLAGESVPADIDADIDSPTLPKPPPES